mmetsp:Transcript_3795/g.14982  ORF Transcript_3795/g.14982 Transcript_3795/m.14982 type:complete len:203 (+) Transcript_3795:2143-2751(+)
MMLVRRDDDVRAHTRRYASPPSIDRAGRTPVSYSAVVVVVVGAVRELVVAPRACRPFREHAADGQLRAVVRRLAVVEVGHRGGLADQVGGHPGGGRGGADAKVGARGLARDHALPASCRRRRRGGGKDVSYSRSQRRIAVLKRDGLVRARGLALERRRQGGLLRGENTTGGGGGGPSQHWAMMMMLLVVHGSSSGSSSSLID